MARVKVALLARLGKCQTKTGRMVTRLHRTIGGMSRRYRSPEISLTTRRYEGITTASQVVWISDGARFWRLYRECAHCAVGISRFSCNNICGKLPASIKMVIRLTLNSSGLPECVINFVTVLVSALSKNGLVKQV